MPESITPELVFSAVEQGSPGGLCGISSAGRLNRRFGIAGAFYLRRAGKIPRSRNANPHLTDQRNATSGEGTRGEDREFREELIASVKDRAENTMIVDLLGTIWEGFASSAAFGSSAVRIGGAPDPVSPGFDRKRQIAAEYTIFGYSESDISLGSITGAPKIRTMQIIDEIETAERGLSMGAIGCYLPNGFGISDSIFELNVAIRTMVIREQEAVFNAGGGITIDSSAEQEYEESLLKAKALLAAMNAKLKLND